MPEGDTVWKIAHTLRPRLVDRELVEVQLRGRRSQVVPERPVVQSVEPVGKHLLVRLGRSAMLRIHLGLHGRWRLGRPGTVPGPRRRLSVLLATEDDVCACFGARSVEVFGAGLRSQHPVLSSLGPDLLVDPVPWDVVAERAAAATAARSISALLLDQRVAAGIGNVYRNEVLFLHGLHPDTPAVDVPPEQVLALFRTAAALLRQNLGPGRRITTRDPRGEPRGGPRHWVYGRAGEPCLRCLTRLRGGRTLENARPSTWCPRCQPEPAERAQGTAW